MNGIQNQHSPALNHVPLIERQVVNVFWDEWEFWNANCAEHRLLPEATTSHDARKCVYQCQDDDSFHGARDYAESEGLRVVFVPGLNVESKERYIPSAESRKVPTGKQTSKERHNCLPAHPQVLRGCENKDFE